MHDLTQLKKVQDYLSKDSRELYLQAGKALGVNAMLLQDNSGLHLFTIATSNRILSILGLVVTTINEIQLKGLNCAKQIRGKRNDFVFLLLE